MPISIHIDALTATEARSIMRELLGQDREVTADGGAVDATAAPEKPKAARSTKAKPDTSAKTVEPGSEPTTETSGEATASSATSATTSPSDASPEEIKKRAMKYTQKAGPQAINELIVNAGAADGAFKSLDADGLTKLDAALAELGY
jgi:hypothetical protein